MSIGHDIMEPIDRTITPNLVLGCLGAFAVAAVLVGVRDEMGNTNVALVLVVVVVVAAATGGRIAGAATSVMAAVSYNFFHTEPYRSLWVDDRTDVITVVLLLLVGFVVGELAARRISNQQLASDRLGEITGVHRVVELVSRGAPRDEVVRTVEREIAAVLHLRGCHFQATSANDLPALGHDGVVDTRHRVWTGSGFALPEEGAQLPVRAGGRDLGRLVLEPTPGTSVALEERVVAVILADQLALTLVGEHLA